MQSRLRGLILSKGVQLMEWWVWILIAVAVILVGWMKLSFFKYLKNKSSKKKFTDED